MRSSGLGRTGRAVLALAFVAFVFTLPAGAADPVPPPSISINDVTMNEGNSATTNFEFTVTLSNPPSGNFTIMVNYATANGTATAGACANGADYVAVSGQLTLNRPNQSRMVTVPVCGDTVFEPNETFSVNLSNPTGSGAVITKGQGVGTIVNDDAAPLRTTSTNVSCGALTVGIGATCTATVTDTDSGTKTTPTGTVTFSSTKAGTFTPCGLTPTATVGVASCTTTYTPTEAGTATITAHYSGDLTHAESEGTTTVTIAKHKTETALSCDDASVPVGVSTTCKATVTDLIATAPFASGKVNFFEDGSSIAFASCMINGSAAVQSCTVSYKPTTAGAHTITASYEGDAAHEGSSSNPFVVTATKHKTETALSCDDASVPVGASTTCKATVTDLIATAPFASGKVNFFEDGSTTAFASCMINGSAAVQSCTVSYKPTTLGAHTITASYEGDAAHEGSSSSNPFVVTAIKRATTTTVKCDDATVPVFSSTECTATVKDVSPGTASTPTGDVTWSSTPSGGGSFSSTTCTLAGSGGEASCSVTFTPTQLGPHTITASYGGDETHTGSSGAFVVTAIIPPSTPLCTVDFATGGGQITTDNGDEANFGGNVHVDEALNSTGQEEYQDKGPLSPMNLHSTNILGVVCTTTPSRQAQIYGTATIDGSGSYLFRIQVKDMGESGTNDTYWIVVSNGYNSGEHKLDSGNVQVH